MNKKLLVVATTLLCQAGRMSAANHLNHGEVATNAAILAMMYKVNGALPLNCKDKDFASTLKRVAINGTLGAFVQNGRGVIDAKFHGQTVTNAAKKWGLSTMSAGLAEGTCRLVEKVTGIKDEDTLHLIRSGVNIGGQFALTTVWNSLSKSKSSSNDS